MATLYTHADRNRWKTVGLMTVFLVFVVVLGWVASVVLDFPELLPVAIIGSIVMSFGSYWWSDRIVLAISRAHYVDPKQGSTSKALYRILENLSITAGLPMPKLYIIDDDAPNAFATGRNPEHGVICVTTGLLRKLNKQELEGVLAHELSHIGNRDILVSTVAVVLVGFVTLLADWMMRSFLWGRGGRDRGRDLGQLGIILAIVGVVLIILSPVFARLLAMAVSRKREFLADASGSLLTRNPEGLASALEKIAADPVQLRVANKATAHLFIANPFTKKRISKLLSTHPPMEERVAILRGQRTA